MGLGALVKTFSRNRWQDLGLAVAGFGIIFVGIDVMQSGMESMASSLLENIDVGDGPLSRLAFFGIGVAATAVTQSSSAAVAVTLTALHSGAMGLDDAAAMVIGVNVGTTITAGMAAIGASTDAKRTAAAHVLFNLVTGVVALLLLPAFLIFIEGVGRATSGDSALMLAAFHTLFNLALAAVFLPLTTVVARLAERIFPEGEKPDGPAKPKYLDSTAIASPKVARACATRGSRLRQRSRPSGAN